MVQFGSKRGGEFWDDGVVNFRTWVGGFLEKGVVDFRELGGGFSKKRAGGFLSGYFFTLDFHFLHVYTMFPHFSFSPFSSP